jgi:diguanylate cyclase (GGDEF)-like protein/PAS domain S-box-containing protein
MARAVFTTFARWLRHLLRRRQRPAAHRGHPGAHQLLRLFEHSDSGVLCCRLDGQIVLCSPAAARLLQVSQKQVVGSAVADWLAPLQQAVGDPAQAFSPGQWETLARRGGAGGGDETRFPVELTVSQTVLDGRPRLILIVRDISDRQLTQQRLSWLANYDSLTGLPNRALFRDRLAGAMARARRSGRAMALMFLDLDRFKLVNDSLGHAVGDQLLRHVADTLGSCLRGADSVLQGSGGPDAFTVSRLGGDEFTVIAENLGSAEEAALIARRILDALEVPFELQDTELHVSASIGISLFPDDETDLDGLIRHTDMAMYRSKGMGRGTYSFYSAELSAELASRLALENALRRALEQREFTLFYQPKASLATGQITGVEALLRWHCPGRGMVSPDRFIGVLEDSSLILPVGAWTLRSACAQLAAWDQAGLPPLTLAVNLSARQFRQPFLARFVAEILAEAGIAPQRLELELTESLLLEDTEATRNVLAALAELGVRVAMDDFGTGHSSLSYLKRFSIDTLKIDRSFVSELPDDAEDAAIATAIIAMGHSLNMKVVAEGVETAAQAEFLQARGCDEVQGYLVSRPRPAAEVARWLRGQAGPEVPGRRVFRETGPSGPMTLPMALTTQ